MFFSFFLILFSLFNVEFLFSDVGGVHWRYLQLEECLLPKDHPLQNKLKRLFKNPHMFESPKQLSQEGFRVINDLHRGLMVASHPSIENYLIKKFQDKVSRTSQLQNYLTRINGARVLRKFIKTKHLHHIVVPQKWLYQLPKYFSDPKTGRRAYLLIVEKIDICKGGKDPYGEVAQRYYNMDFDILRELCMVVYYFRGLDSGPQNMPFTYHDKIAFIDTEHWRKQEREGFLPYAMSYLSEDRQEYALTVFKEIDKQNRR